MGDAADLPNDDTDYTITSQDTLQVAIFQVPDLNRIVRVDGTGFVSLPLIGRVPVRGKSLLQAQEDIAARYGRSYLRSPQVTLSLVKSGQRVTVNGAVKSPTVLTLDGHADLEHGHCTEWRSFLNSPTQNAFMLLARQVSKSKIWSST